MGAGSSKTTVNNNSRARLVDVGPKPATALRANQITEIKKLFDRVQEGGVSYDFNHFQSILYP